MADLLTQDSLQDLLPIEVKGLSNYLADDDYENAVNDALRDTGWTFPLSGDARQVGMKELWLKTRAKRHLFFYLMSESAHKFKYDVIALNQRFDHYKAIVDAMDKDWTKFIDDNPELFVTNASDWFCTKVDAGFAYNEVGEDLTYDSDVPVFFSGLVVGE
jgi:hypothetical protein